MWVEIVARLHGAVDSMALNSSSGIMEHTEVLDREGQNTDQVLVRRRRDETHMWITHKRCGASLGALNSAH